MENSKKLSKEPTLGEGRVRTRFNVANDSGIRSNVDATKQDTAMLIDRCEAGIQNVANREDLTPKAKSEAIRLWSLAQTAYEQAAMWAVKAETI
jgi:hypothetical protein